MLPALATAITTLIPSLVQDVTGIFKRVQTGEIDMVKAQTEMQRVINDGLVPIYSLAEKQIDNNIIDAQSGNKYQSFWRPTIAWVCVAAMTLHYLVFPISISIVAAFDAASGLAFAQALPQLDIAEILGIVSTLLGMGGIRTFEKLKSQKFSRELFYSELRKAIGPLNQQLVAAIEQSLNKTL